MLSRITAVIRREYLERVRTKAFWISTLIVPIFMAVMMIVPAWLASRGAGEFTVAVLDLSGRFFGPVQQEIERRLSGDDETLIIHLELREPGEEPNQTREQLKTEVREKHFDGLLVIPDSLPDEGSPEYIAPNVATFRMIEVLGRAVNDVVIAERLTAAGLDPEAVGELTRRVGLTTIKLGKGGEETSDRGQTFLLTYVLIMIIYITVLIYGMYVMRGVLEEKASHVVEVVVSTVKPFELMLGKILGIGGVGLTQFLIWTVVMTAVTAPGAVSALGMKEIELPALPAQLMAFFVVYFLLGFLLYGTLYAAVGASFDTEQEAQHFQIVVISPFIATLLLQWLIFNQPDSTLSIVLSLIPFFTPMLMFLRMTLTDVPVIQIIASVVLMVSTILVFTWFAGKIYRFGILMHGSKPKLKELVRWIKEA